MKRGQSSDAWYLLAFFAAAILSGALLLLLPVSWAGKAGTPDAVRPVDALFLSTSAVCVTGLSTVDVAAFSRFGQLVILALIQVGGLGIVSFTSLLLILPGGRLPFRRVQTIRGFSVDGVEYDPKRIIRTILASTAVFEAAGALALFPQFRAAGEGDAAFLAVFHSISAFCNAGLSPLPTSLEAYSGKPLLLAVIAALIVTGGIGFIVLQDLGRRALGRRRTLNYHSRLVLGATAVLILGGAAAFWLLERRHAYAGMGPADQIANALFQAVTPRTAGFDSVSQAALRQPSRYLTILLMFIGGCPGSIAGGVKVSTAFLVLLALFRRADDHGDLNVFRRRIPAQTAASATSYCNKALILLVAAVGALSVAEQVHGADLEKIIFEAVSAFGTVGLSLGITQSLTTAGKLVLIATMFAGRVGLVAIAFPAIAKPAARIAYRRADVLIG